MLKRRSRPGHYARTKKKQKIYNLQKSFLSSPSLSHLGPSLNGYDRKPPSPLPRLYYYLPSFKLRKLVRVLLTLSYVKTIGMHYIYTYIMIWLLLLFLFLILDVTKQLTFSTKVLACYFAKEKHISRIDLKKYVFCIVR